MTVSPRRNVAGFNLKSYLLSSWWARHLIVILIGAAGTWLFLYSRSEWSPMHR